MDTLPAILSADPKANFLAHQDEIEQAIGNTLASGQYILGEEVAAFENEFATYLGMEHVIGVGSGTDALELALRVLGVGPGDGVLTVSHTAVATVAAIGLTGATPVFVDIDPVTFTMDVESLGDCISEYGNKQLKVIIPVHLYGQPANMPRIMEVAAKHSLYVLEDCAQAHGAKIGRRQVGTWGDMAAFSFYPTKNLGALGDGGALVCHDATLAARARRTRQYGWRERYISELRGMNTRLDALQAAVLRVKLRHLDAENERRRNIAALYDSSLQDLDLRRPGTAEGVTHVFHQYTVLTPRRDDLAAYLRSKDIQTTILYPLPVHLQPAYKEHALQPVGGLPVSEKVCRELLCLPIHPQLTDSQVRKVAQEIVHWQQATPDAVLV
jgi:dTDP-4-amino-4,6-dideoxygalactose transaminase